MDEATRANIDGMAEQFADHMMKIISPDIEDSVWRGIRLGIKSATNMMSVIADRLDAEGIRTITPANLRTFAAEIQRQYEAGLVDGRPPVSPEAEGL